MARPSDLPAADKYKHGTRARYVTGCRCEDCRTANREYARQRARAQIRGDWNGLVDAAQAREHLVTLSKAGVGRRSVQAACDVALTVLEDIKSGKKTRIRARTERAILTVDSLAIADHALVPAAETWKLIELLLTRHHFTKGEIAKALGLKTPALQPRKGFVLVATAQRVKKLYRQTVEGETHHDIESNWESEKPACRACGKAEHGDNASLVRLKAKERRPIVRMMLPDTAANIRKKLPCLYTESDSSKRKQLRDLRDAGALSDYDPHNYSHEPVWRLTHDYNAEDSTRPRPDAPA